MIPLHPVPEASYQCPKCGIALKVTGWYMPGMRTLADLRCKQCGREYFGDLPAGHGLYYPMLMDKDAGKVYDQVSMPWFSQWLADSYAQRKTETLLFSVEELKPLNRTAVVLNCLDRLYGHCVLKILNAQYYLDHTPEISLIVLVPRFLRWMVPDGVTTVYTVDLPLSRGWEWNDWLAEEIYRSLSALERCYLSVAFPHPHPEDFDIERFTGVMPFPKGEWDVRLSEDPRVTFIWREDRSWNWVKARSGKSLADAAHGIFWGAARKKEAEVSSRRQTANVVQLAAALKKRYKGLKFAVVGQGAPGDLPHYVTDMRTTQVEETTERAWCEQYALSHVVVGVHGSNMLLPSAHAGAVVELMPLTRWGNIVQDLIFNLSDQREALFGYRILPLDTPPPTVAAVVGSILSGWSAMEMLMRRDWCRHGRAQDMSRWVQVGLSAKFRWAWRHSL